MEQHGELFENPVFHTLEAEVVFVENGAGAGDVAIVGAVFVPGQTAKCVEIGVLYRIVGRRRIETPHFLGFPSECVHHNLRHAGRFGTGYKCVDFVILLAV